MEEQAALVDTAVGDVPEAQQHFLTGVRGQVVAVWLEARRGAVQALAEWRVDRTVAGDGCVRCAAVRGHLDVGVVEAELRAVLGEEGQRRATCRHGDRDNCGGVEVVLVARPQHRVARSVGVVVDDGPP